MFYRSAKAGIVCVYVCMHAREETISGAINNVSKDAFTDICGKVDTLCIRYFSGVHFKIISSLRWRKLISFNCFFEYCVEK